MNKNAPRAVIAIVLALFLVADIVGGLTTFVWLHPARCYEIITLFFGIPFLIALLLFWLTRMKSIPALQIFMRMKKSAWPLAVTLSGCVGMTFTIIMLIANAKLDHAPAQNFDIPVIDKDWFATKYSPGYYAIISSPVPAELGISFDPYEHIPLSRQQYEHVMPGDIAKLNIHPGFFGIPWYNQARDAHIENH